MSPWKSPWHCADTVLVVAVYSSVRHIMNPIFETVDAIALSLSHFFFFFFLESSTLCLYIMEVDEEISSQFACDEGISSVLLHVNSWSDLFGS